MIALGYHTLHINAMFGTALLNRLSAELFSMLWKDLINKILFDQLDYICIWKLVWQEDSKQDMTSY